MSKSHILDRHIDFKKTSVTSKEKLKDIKRYLGMFLNSKKKSLDKFTEEDIVKFINSLTKKFSIRTINDIKCHLKVFIKWYYRDYSSRFRNLDKLCKQQKPPRAYKPEQMLKEEDVKKLIKSEKDLMFKVYWMVFFFGGFRPSECASLEWDKNIFFEKEGVIIKVLATKTTKEFIKSLPKEAEHLLKEWRQYNHSKFVFPSTKLKDQPIKARGICGRLKRLSKNVLGYEVVPYALRHSFATLKYNDKELKKKGISDDDIAQQLGHTKNMKHTYLNLSEDALKANARMLWVKTKPLTPEEKDKIRDLEKKIKLLEKKEERNRLTIEYTAKTLELLKIKNPKIFKKT